MPASATFLDVCQAQIELLVEGAEATLGIVYVTGDDADPEGSPLVPVWVYPESAQPWTTVAWWARSPTSQPLLPSPDPRTLSANPPSPSPSRDAASGGIPLVAPTSELSTPLPSPPAPSPPAPPSDAVAPIALADAVADASSPQYPDQHLDQLDQHPDVDPGAEPAAAFPAAASLPGTDVTSLPLVHQELAAALRLAQFGPYQVVLPLVRDGLVLGLLAVGRQEPWTAIARSQVETVARTLAATALMDRRHRWLERLYHHHQTQRHQQQEQLHNLLHQFRNPLTAIRTFGKLVLRRLQPGAREQTMAEGILRESERLQALLEQFGYVVDWDRDDHAVPPSPQRVLNLLPAAESAPGPLLLPGAANAANPPTRAANPPTQPACSLAETLDQAIASTQAIAREKSITVTVHLPETLPPVRATPALLQEVASNLMDNAVKYTPAGGQVQIVAAVGMPQPERGAPQGDRPWVVWAVSDTGYGIPAADLERVFERRYRGIQAETDIPGTGLGLAIAQQAIQSMGGNIRAFSPAIPLADLLQPDPAVPQRPAPSPTQGSTFALWLLPADSTHVA